MSSTIAQIDTVRIKEIKVTASKIRTQHIGGHAKSWKTSELAELPSTHLADLLSQKSGTYIKSYGMGSLATSSIRGGSAGHTLVLWNGLPIQSPMLGLLDLSLLPVNGFEEISLQKGGNSAMWGSGAIGGVINLKPLSNFKERWKVNLQSSIGSFGQFSQGAKINLGNRNFQSVTKLLHQQSDNDFYYFLAPNLPLRQQTNAQLKQFNLLQDFYWKINNKNQIGFHLWRQHSDRQIPPTNVQTSSEAYQEDYSNRMILDWKRISNHIVIQSKVAIFDEELDYYDDAIGLESLSHFTTYLAELITEWNWKNFHKISIGSTHSSTTAESDGYPNSPTEHRTALFGAYQFRKSNWAIQSSIRQEIVNDQWVPLIPNLGIDYTWNKNFTSKIKLSKNYRLPTLNDRFWAIGGNPNLLAESGWSAEGSLVTKFKLGKIEGNYTVTAFNRLINNRIIWLPLEGKPFWGAQNVSRVWSRGFEQEISLSFKTNDWNFQLDAGYDRIKSTNQESIEFPRTEKGEQLIYIPENQAFGNFSISYKKIAFSYQHNYTSSVGAINEVLDSYHIAHVKLQYAKAYKSFQGIIFFKINNLWNKDYFVVERRPMPRRHFQLGVQFQIGKK